MEISNVISLPTMSFRSNGIMFYETLHRVNGSFKRSALFNNNAKLLAKRERYTGMVTDAVKKRMKKAITLLIQSTPNQYQIHPVTGRTVCHKLSFITLTTPTHAKSLNASWCHKNLLEPMLLLLRRKHGMRSYIWKCELQSNGQVHYHLTCDIMLNHTTLRDNWNSLLIKHQLLDDFKKSMAIQTLIQRISTKSIISTTWKLT